MKNLTIPSLITIGMILLIGAANVNAAETRYQYYEMGDGAYVKFRMSPEEIKAQNAENARLAATRKASATQPKQWVTRIELPESGKYLEFPMSAEEIRLAKSQEALAVAARDKSQKICAPEKAGVESEVIEMADGAAVIFSDEYPTTENGVSLSDLRNRNAC